MEIAHNTKLEKQKLNVVFLSKFNDCNESENK